MSLDLRPMVVSDAEALFEIYRDPAMWAYDPPRVHTDVAQTWAYCERAAARWETDGLSYWTARLAGSDEVVGSGGAQLHRGTFWNLNYRVAAAHQGRGLAGEVLAAALVAAAQADPGRPCIAWIDATNPASRRVAERGGLVDRGLRRGSVDDVPRLAHADRVLDDGGYPPVAQ